MFTRPERISIMAGLIVCVGLTSTAVLLRDVWFALSAACTWGITVGLYLSAKEREKRK